jgi:hypothetical protein
LADGGLLSIDTAGAELLWSRRGRRAESGAPALVVALAPHGGWALGMGRLGPDTSRLSLGCLSASALQPRDIWQDRAIWQHPAVSPDGWVAAGVKAGSQDPLIMLRRPKDGEMLKVSSGTVGNLRAVAIGPGSDPWVAWTDSLGKSRGYRVTVASWNRRGASMDLPLLPERLAVVPGELPRFAFLQDRELFLWDLSARRVCEDVGLFAMDPSGARAVVASGGSLRVVGLDEGERELARLDLPEPRFDRVTSLAVSGDGALVAAGLERGVVVVYRLPD